MFVKLSEKRLLHKKYIYEFHSLYVLIMSVYVIDFVIRYSDSPFAIVDLLLVDFRKVKVDLAVMLTMCCFNISAIFEVSFILIVSP